MSSAPPAMSAVRGSACDACGVATYPPTASCPRCGDELEQRELARRGTLWTWTVQRYAPKSPPYEPRADTYEPFVVGYVELPDGVRVEAVLDAAPDEVTIGMELEIFSAGVVPHGRPVTK